MCPSDVFDGWGAETEIDGTLRSRSWLVDAGAMRNKKTEALHPSRARERWETSLACAGARTMMVMMLHGGR